MIATAEGPRSTCRSSACDWYAEHADLSRGVPQITTSFHLTAKVASSETLRVALAPLTADELYLVGTFTAPQSKALPPTIEVTGDQVMLIYADPSATWITGPGVRSPTSI